MNSPAETDDEKLRLAADIVGRVYEGGLDLAHDLREMAARVAVVRPTRDQLAAFVREKRFAWIGDPATWKPGDEYHSAEWFADALLDAFWGVAVSDAPGSPEGPQ